MTESPKSREELVKVFAELATSFKQAEALVSDWEGDLARSLDALRRIVYKPMFDDTALPKKHPLREVVSEHTEGLRAHFATWEHCVHTYDAETRFAKRFGDSLMIFVYGKVKAGKSSLGNYVAYGAASPSDVCVATANPQPEFFYETGNASCEGMTAERMAEQRRFGVDILETTSSIQGFSLPGLTWVDSPGLHSLNAENGLLAEKYVRSADLVLYLSNSGSPGRRSDLQEITGLLKDQKNLLVLISGSDTVDEDVDDDGNFTRRLVMKCPSDRDAQEDYLSKEIQALPDGHKQLLVSAQVASISVKYAEESASVSRWSESGLEAFAAHVAEVAQSRGVKIKREVPLRNFDTYCGKYLESIRLVREHCDIFAGNIEERSKRAEREVQRIKFDISRDVARIIERAGEDHAMDDEKFVTASRKACEGLASDGAGRIVRAFGEILSCVELPKFESVAGDLPGFDRESEQISYHSSRNEKLGSAGAATAGGGIGFVIAGPPGMLIGTLIGGAVGHLVGRQFDNVKTISIDVGDNRDEVVATARETFQKAVAAALDAVEEQMKQVCFSASEAWLKEVGDQLVSLERDVEANREKLKGVLNDVVA